MSASQHSPNEQYMLGSPHSKHVGELLGSDPVAGNDAVEYFASQGPQCLRMFVPLEGDPPSASEHSWLRFARLCRRFGDASIPILCEGLEKGGWFTKLRAASGFDCYPSGIANDSAERRLGGLLVHPDLNTVRCTMLALGYMGAHTWAAELTREDVASPKRGRYVFEKLAPFALDAMLMMIARSKGASENHLDHLLGLVEYHFAAMEEHLHRSDTAALHTGCLKFGPYAADTLIRNWLRHTRPLYRNVSLSSLSSIGLRRTATAIAGRLEDSSEDDDLRRFAARALGDIGSPVALETLERWLNRPDLTSKLRGGILWGLASVYPEAPRPLDPNIIHEILLDRFQASLHLVHSLGFRRECEVEVRHCMHDSDPMMRGAAALSLARIRGREVLVDLSIAHREATDNLERALVLCALIFAGEISFAHELSAALAEVSGISLVSRRWKDEFVGALAASPDARFAEAWSEAMGVEVAGCQDRLTAWNGAYPAATKSTASLVASEIPRKGAAPQPEARDLIFVSYSHADKDLCSEFLKMLHPTAKRHGLKIWSDQNIPVGTKWRDEIEKALAHTQIAVLLVSPDFLTSSFIETNELPPLLEAASTQGTKIFWIACRPSNIEDTELVKFQGANRPSKPLSKLSKVAREGEMQRISQELFCLSRGATEG